MILDSRRGQTSTEYLILLAVVIIIALVLVSVLAGFPKLGGSAKGKASDAFWVTQPIGVEFLALSETNEDSLLLRNNRQGPIIIHDVRLHTSLLDIDSGSLFVNAGNASLYNQTLNVGDSYKYTNNSAAIGMNIPWTHLHCVAGESYTVYIEIDYEDVQTGSVYVFDGGKRSLQGICAS